MKFFNLFTKRNRNQSESKSLTDILVDTWNELNVELLSPYLADDFQYNSVWVNTTMKGKDQYLDYLRKKFETIKKSGDTLVADIIEEKGIIRARLRQRWNGVETILDMTEKDGKITHLIMRPIAEISIMDREEWNSYAKAYYAVLPKCLQVGGKSIQDYVSSKGYGHPDFAWIQTSLINPSFQHLCFRYLSDVYSIIIAVHGFFRKDGKDDDRIIVCKQDYENLINESKKYNLIPCFLPIAARPQMPLIDGIHLIHAISGEFITLENSIKQELVPMSDWEINNMGIQTVLDYLSKNNHKINAYTDVVGIEPQIWFEKDGKTSYVIVRAIPTGKRKEKFRINKNLLLRLKDYDGYFADVQFASANAILKDDHGNTVPLGKRDGDGDIWMWRGDGFYCYFNGVQEINKAIEDNHFIELYDAESYDIK